MKRKTLLLSLVWAMWLAGLGLRAQVASTAEAAYRTQDWPRAAREYEAVTEREPKNALAWYRLGLSLHKMARYEQAIPAFQQALELGFARVFATYNIAAGYARLGDKARTLEWLSRLSALGFQNVKQLEADEDFSALRADADFQLVMGQLRHNATPCESSAEHRQFDFWIGEWDVQTTAGQPAGSSSVLRILDGCVIFENWFGGGGGTGKSFNLYNTPKKRWQQYWVDSSGTVTLFEGGLEEGKMRLAGETFPMKQTTGMRRMTFTPLGPDQVRQVGETSADGGKTWTLEYDLTYIRKPKSP